MCSHTSMEVPIGSGSGYVWDLEGHIVTNFHVVQQATSAQVAILTPSSTSVVGNDLITANSSGGVMTNAVNPFTSARPGALGSSGSSALNGFTRNVYKARVIGVDPTKGKHAFIVSIETS
jgi:S1-C subfamily serine protease